MPSQADGHTRAATATAAATTAADRTAEAGDSRMERAEEATQVVAAVAPMVKEKVPAPHLVQFTAPAPGPAPFSTMTRKCI
jgi:hypothetical protein